MKDLGFKFANGGLADMRLLTGTHRAEFSSSKRWAPGQQDLFPYQTLSERMRALTIAMCRRTLDDPKASRDRIESALTALDDMLKELPA